MPSLFCVFIQVWLIITTRVVYNAFWNTPSYLSYIVLLYSVTLYSGITLYDIVLHYIVLLPKGKNKKVIGLMKDELGDYDKFVG